MNNRTVNASPEPKKSARLAEKRKLREEAGTGPNSSADGDYCFTSYSYGKSGTTNQSKSSSKNATPPLPSPVISPKSESTKSKGVRIGSPTCVKNSAGKSPQKRPYPSPTKSNSFSEVEEFEHETNTNLIPSVASLIKTKPTTPSKIIIINDEEQVSLDEEKWLDALEAGKLEELDIELKQIKNPKALTARQKALSEKRDRDFGFIEDQTSHNASGQIGKDNILTPEMIQLKAKKTEQRKLLAQAKKVEDQKKTVEKLLNKPYSKGGRNSNKNKGFKKPNGPIISSVDRPDKKIIIFPPGMEIPFITASEPLRLPNKIICGVSGCSNLKKYFCPQTHLPACSFECYKKNKADHGAEAQE